MKGLPYCGWKKSCPVPVGNYWSLWKTVNDEIIGAGFIPSTVWFCVDIPFKTIQEWVFGLRSLSHFYLNEAVAITYLLLASLFSTTFFRRDVYTSRSDRVIVWWIPTVPKCCEFWWTKQIRAQAPPLGKKNGPGRTESWWLYDNPDDMLEYIRYIYIPCGSCHLCHTTSSSIKMLTTLG